MKHEIEGNSTRFSLEAGTELKLGRLSVKLVERTDVSVDAAISYDAVVENIYGSGNGPVNAKSVQHKTRRGGVSYDVRYGAGGWRIETEAVRAPAKAKPIAKKEPEKKASAQTETKKSGAKTTK